MRLSGGGGQSGKRADLGPYVSDEVPGSRKGVRVWVRVKGGLDKGLLLFWGSLLSCEVG